MPPTNPAETPHTAGPEPELADATAAIAAVADAVAGAPDATGAGGPTAADLLDALALLRRVQQRLAALEPALIAAARRAGVSWQELAPALGVASRQAAERRYLRLAPSGGAESGSTGDERVRAERDRRAGHRAVARWANDHTAELHRLAGRITTLTDLDDAAAADLARLRHAVAGRDAAALPALLTDAHRHLGAHPDLARQVDAVTIRADQVRRDTQQGRDTATS